MFQQAHNCRMKRQRYRNDYLINNYYNMEARKLKGRLSAAIRTIENRRIRWLIQQYEAVLKSSGSGKEGFVQPAQEFKTPHNQSPEKEVEFSLSKIKTQAYTVDKDSLP